jgi:pimeloyl-ACP methyl ester carboxylesterase
MQTPTPLQQQATWSWREQSIHYIEAGDRHSQAPPLLLVHGFGASTDHWRKNIADLQADHHVWAIDLLGFGRSAKPDWQYSGELWRDQLSDFIAERIQRPTILVGNSLGGYASLCVAADRPELVAGVVLLNSAGPFSDRQPTRQPSPIRQAWGRLMRSLLLQPWPSYLLFQYVRRRSTIRKTLKKVYLDHDAITDQLVEEIYQPSCDPGAARVFAAIFKAPKGEFVDALLHRMTCPLLMLWGDGDPWMDTRQRGAAFRQHYPQLTDYYLPAGHCPHDEIPDEVNRLIRQWVSQVSR